MKLKVILQKAEEGGYIVSYTALPGCHSQGDTVEEALENIREAITGCLVSNKIYPNEAIVLFGIGYD